ncbi:UNVERIFIED_CONTAM: hypothetical protein GTU68_009963 [Idotea baltica]|nr:hypothetical protein [Idotea baltica]
MAEQNFDLVVLGGGPGGYVAAIRATQLGLKTAIIDENPQFGGTCLRVGCIPSKALLESSHLLVEARDNMLEHGISATKLTVDLAAMMKRKTKVVDTLTGGINMLLKRNKVTCYVGRGTLAAGRSPNTKSVGLEAAGIKADRHGFIEVDEHLQTSVAGTYAIGDCIGGAMLAHKASEEGIAVVEHIANGTGHINYDTIPAVVYTHPEIAMVGKTEEQLKEAGIEYRKGACPYGANGRALAMGEASGKIKILADAKTDRILGVHAIGARAGDLIAEAAVAMNFGASSEDIARCCHAHPTLSEIMLEAALAVDGRAIHT